MDLAFLDLGEISQEGYWAEDAAIPGSLPGFRI